MRNGSICVRGPERNFSWHGGQIDLELLRGVLAAIMSASGPLKSVVTEGETRTELFLDDKEVMIESVVIGGYRSYFSVNHRSREVKKIQNEWVESAVDTILSVYFNNEGRPNAD